MRLSRYITQDGTPYATAGGATIAAPYNDMLKVPDGADDTARGTALLATYEAAKLLTPHGNALAADNRATVLIPDGAYRLTETLVLDTDFVDLRAVNVTDPAIPSETYVWRSPSYHDTNYFPQVVSVYSDLVVSVVEQTARDVRLQGFTIANTFSIPLTEPQVFNPGYHGFIFSGLGDNSNDRSVYDRMNFWHAMTSTGGNDDYSNLSTDYSESCNFSKHVSGTWTNCVFGAMSIRLGPGGVFTANMTDCWVGPYSIGGDVAGGYFGSCRLERVTCLGLMDGAEPDGSGTGGFGGCDMFGIPATPDSWFVDCVSGRGSFSTGKDAGGNYLRCIGGPNSFGKGFNGEHQGGFSGYAEDCQSGPGSFGGRVSDQSIEYGNVNGTLLRCSTRLPDPNPSIIDIDWTYGWLFEGATVTDCEFEISGNRNCIELLDSDSVITGSTILVTQGGTGYPVYAATPQDVDISGCVMNNASHDADGLSPNVTNIAANPNNTVTDT